MLLEVITPEKLLFKGEVAHVQMPGIDGSFGVLKGHAPLVSALKAGVVSVQQADGEKEGEYADTKANSEHFDFDVKGGVVEVYENKIIILAE